MKTLGRWSGSRGREGSSTRALLPRVDVVSDEDLPNYVDEENEEEIREL